ncbi:MAG TPA: J domain-containing protein, partial [Erwinia sp.]|nr:J domain-containing protein [Erwinia sp.]
MGIWQTLELSPTSDEGEIRRAYARQLKKHRPDSDPEGYQRLREAFDEAKQWARADIVNDEYISADVSPLVRQKSEPEPLLQAREVANSFTVEETGSLPEAGLLYSEEALHKLAYQLVNTEMTGIIMMNLLSQKVFKAGSLQQQQLFHQHLAAALAETPGLTEGLLDRISGLLGWGMDEYDYSHIIPSPIQQALQEQLRETQINRAWKEMEAEEKHGMLLNRAAIRLLKSKGEKVPFWIRLIPGLLTLLARHANSLMHYYPEIVPRLNQPMLHFLRQPRATLSWQGIFLLVFWALVFNAVIPLSGINATVSTIAVATVMFYLYINDAVMLGLHSRPKWAKWFLFTEFIFSLMAIQLFFGGLFFAAIVGIPPSGPGAVVLVALLAILILSIIFWAAWPQNTPFIRCPGKVMSRIFASPWALIEWMDFS